MSQAQSFEITMADASFLDFTIAAEANKVKRFDLTITVRDANGAIVSNADIAGWKFYFTAKLSRRDDDVDAIITVNTVDDAAYIQILDAAQRKVRLTLKEGIFNKDIEPRDYLLYCDFQGINNVGEPSILLRGMLSLLVPVTQAND